MVSPGTSAVPQGDDRQERFLELFLPEQHAIRAFIRSTIWDRARCDDLFQEVALVLWRELDRYDPQRPFGAWARGVAAKTVLKAMRDIKRAPVSLSPDAIHALETAFDELSRGGADVQPSRQQEALRDCLDRLPDRARTLVRFRYRDALTVADIAPRVANSPEAVQKALTRLRDSLHKCIERRLRATAT